MYKIQLQAMTRALSDKGDCVKDENKWMALSVAKGFIQRWGGRLAKKKTKIAGAAKTPGEEE